MVQPFSVGIAPATGGPQICKSLRPPPASRRTNECVSPFCPKITVMGATFRIDFNFVAETWGLPALAAIIALYRGLAAPHEHGYSAAPVALCTLF